MVSRRLVNQPTTDFSRNLSEFTAPRVEAMARRPETEWNAGPEALGPAWKGLAGALGSLGFGFEGPGPGEALSNLVSSLFGSACVYGQVLKKRRNNRVIRVERRVKIGRASRLQPALWETEDSQTLNTSFVERLNLTIRQAAAYLRRRSRCHARSADQLRSHVELVRCHYNVVRAHSALRFGRETRTPAMRASLVSTRLALGDIFTACRFTLRFLVATVETDEAEFPTFSWPHEQRTAA